MCLERWRRSTFCTGSGESTAHGCDCHWSDPKSGRPLSSKMRSMSFEAFSVLTSPTSDPTATQRPGERSRKSREQPGEPREQPGEPREQPGEPRGLPGDPRGQPGDPRRERSGWRHSPPAEPENIRCPSRGKDRLVIVGTPFDLQRLHDIDAKEQTSSRFCHVSVSWRRSAAGGRRTPKEDPCRAPTPPSPPPPNALGRAPGRRSSGERFESSRLAVSAK